MSELTVTRTPRNSLSPTREANPVFFSRPDQRPSVAASDLVSFGGGKDEGLDDSVSLAASDAEDQSSSIYDSALPQSGQPSEPKLGTDAKHFRVMFGAMDELGLEWSPPEEPTRSHLDEWFLPGRCQAP